MTNLTTTNLQHLLEQATPGPWEAEDLSFCECCIDVKAPAGLICTADMDDAPLIAHAPQLAQEVLRMRRELESMQSAWLLMYADPEFTPTEQEFAAHVVDHIDSVLGDHDE